MGSPKVSVRVLGVLSLFCYLIHGADSIHRGEPWNLLWGCNLASLFIGAGLLARRASPAAVGVVWLFFGVALWVLDLANGGQFIATSLLTHFGALILGVAGLRSLGLPRGTWWKAVLAAILLQLISRGVAPARENVNLSAAVWTGWERRFPSFAVYLACVVAAQAATFLAAERGLSRFLARESA